MEVYREEMINRWHQSQQSGNASAGVTKANFSLVAGTELLNEQIQAIQPRIHIFGKFNSILFHTDVMFPRS